MKRTLTTRFIVSMVTLLIAAPYARAVSTLDFTTADSEAWINGALFQTVDNRSTGTGTIQSFVRISTNDETSEGYNTDGRALEFDENSSPQFTRQLPLSAVPIVSQTEPGESTADYYEFLLDINQNLHDPDWFLSLDKLQIAVLTSPDELGYSPIFDAPIFDAPIYDIDFGEDVRIKLNAQLNSGSGSGDLVVYIPTSLFPSDPTGQYVYFYSMFGEGGEFGNNDGFEEWAVQSAALLPIVPAPSAVILGSIGAAFIGWLRVRTKLL